METFEGGQTSSSVPTSENFVTQYVLDGQPLQPPPPSLIYVCQKQSEEFGYLMEKIRACLKEIIPEHLITEACSNGSNSMTTSEETEEDGRPVSVLLQGLKVWGKYLATDDKRPSNALTIRDEERPRSDLNRELESYLTKTKRERRKTAERVAMLKTAELMKMRELEKIQKKRRSLQAKEVSLLEEAKLANKNAEHITNECARTLYVESQHMRKILDETEGCLKGHKKNSEFEFRCVNSLREVKKNWELARSDQKLDSVSNEGRFYMNHLNELQRTIFSSPHNQSSELLNKWSDLTSLVSQFQSLLSLAKILQEATDENALSDWKKTNDETRFELKQRVSKAKDILEERREEQKLKIRVDIECEKLVNTISATDDINQWSLLSAPGSKKRSNSNAKLGSQRTRDYEAEKSSAESSGEILKSSLSGQPKRQQANRKSINNNNNNNKKKREHKFDPPKKLKRKFKDLLDVKETLGSSEADDRGSDSCSSDVGCVEVEREFSPHAQTNKYQPLPKQRKLSETAKQGTIPSVATFGTDKRFGFDRETTKDEASLFPKSKEASSSSIRAQYESKRKTDDALSVSAPPKVNRPSSSWFTDVSAEYQEKRKMGGSDPPPTTGVKKPFVQTVQVFNQYSKSNSSASTNSQTNSPHHSHSGEDPESEDVFLKDIPSFVSSGQGRGVGLRLLEKLDKLRRQYNEEPVKCFDPNDASQYSEIKRFKKTYGVVSLYCDEYTQSRSTLPRSDGVQNRQQRRDDRPISDEMKFPCDHTYTVTQTVRITSSPGKSNAAFECVKKESTSEGPKKDEHLCASSKVSFVQNRATGGGGGGSSTGSNSDYVNSLIDSLTFGGDSKVGEEKIRAVRKNGTKDAYSCKIGEYSARIAANWMIVGLIDEVRVACDFQQKIKEDHLKVLKDPGTKYMGLSDYEIDCYAQKVYRMRMQMLETYILPKLQASDKKDVMSDGNLFLTRVPSLSASEETIFSSSSRRKETVEIKKEGIGSQSIRADRGNATSPSSFEFELAWIPWYLTSRCASGLNSNGWDNLDSNRRSSDRTWSQKMAEYEQIDGKSVLLAHKKRSSSNSDGSGGGGFSSGRSNFCYLPQWGEDFQMTQLNVFFPGNHSSLRRFFGEKWSMSSLGSPSSVSSSYQANQKGSQLSPAFLGNGSTGGSKRNSAPSKKRTAAEPRGRGSKQFTRKSEIETGSGANPSFLLDPKPYDFWDKMTIKPEPEAKGKLKSAKEPNDLSSTSTPSANNRLLYSLSTDVEAQDLNGRGTNKQSRKPPSAPKIKKMCLMSSAFFSNDVQGGVHNGLRCPKVLEEMSDYLTAQLLNVGQLSASDFNDLGSAATEANSNVKTEDFSNLRSLKPPLPATDVAAVTNRVLSFQSSQNKETFVDEVNVHPLVHSAPSWILRDCCRKAWAVGSNVLKVWGVEDENEQLASNFDIVGFTDSLNLIAEPQALVLSHQSQMYGHVVGVPTTVGQWEEKHLASSDILKGVGGGGVKRKKKSTDREEYDESEDRWGMEVEGEREIGYEGNKRKFAPKYSRDSPCRCISNQRTPGTGSNFDTYPEYFAQGSIWAELPGFQPPIAKKKNKDVLTKKIEQQLMQRSAQHAKDKAAGTNSFDKNEISSKFANNNTGQAKHHHQTSDTNSIKTVERSSSHRNDGGKSAIPKVSSFYLDGMVKSIKSHTNNQQQQQQQQQQPKRKRIRKPKEEGDGDKKTQPAPRGRPRSKSNEIKGNGSTRGSKRGSGGGGSQVTGPAGTKKGRPSKFKYFSDLYHLKDVFENQKLLSIGKLGKVDSLSPASISLSSHWNNNVEDTSEDETGGNKKNDKRSSSSESVAAKVDWLSAIYSKGINEDDDIANFFIRDYALLLNSDGSLKTNWIELVDDNVAEFVLACSPWEDPNKAQVLPMHASVTLISECMDLVSTKDGMVISLDIDSYRTKAESKVKEETASFGGFKRSGTHGGSAPRFDEERQRSCDNDNTAYQGVYNVIGGHSLNLVVGMHRSDVIDEFKKCCDHVYKAYCAKKGLSAEVGRKRLNKIRATVIDCLASELFPTPVYSPSNSLSVWDSKLPCGFWRYDVDQRDARKRQHERYLEETERAESNVPVELRSPRTAHRSPLESEMQKCNGCGGKFGGNGNVFPSGVPQYCMGVFFSTFNLAQRNKLLFDPNEPERTTVKRDSMSNYVSINERCFHDRGEKVNETCLSGVTFRKSLIVCKSQSPDGKVSSFYGYKNPSIEASGLSEIAKIEKVPYFGPTDSPCSLSVLCTDLQEFGSSKSQWGREWIDSDPNEGFDPVTGLTHPPPPPPSLRVVGSDEVYSLKHIENIIGKSVTNERDCGRKLGGSSRPSTAIPLRYPICEEEVAFGIFKCLKSIEHADQKDDTNFRYRKLLTNVPNRYAPNFDVQQCADLSVRPNDPLLYEILSSNLQSKQSIMQAMAAYANPALQQPQQPSASDQREIVKPGPSAHWILFNWYFNRANRQNRGLFGSRFSSKFPVGFKAPNPLAFLRLSDKAMTTEGKFEIQLFMDHPKTRELGPAKFDARGHRNFGSEDILNSVCELTRVNAIAEDVPSSGSQQRKEAESRQSRSKLLQFEGSGSLGSVENKLAGKILSELNKNHKLLYSVLHDPEIDSETLKRVCYAYLDRRKSELECSCKALLQTEEIDLEAVDDSGRTIGADDGYGFRFDEEKEPPPPPPTLLRGSRLATKYAWFLDLMDKDKESYASLEDLNSVSPKERAVRTITKMEDVLEMIEWLLCMLIAEEEVPVTRSTSLQMESVKKGCTEAWQVLIFLKALNLKTTAKSVRKMLGLSTKRWCHFASEDKTTDAKGVASLDSKSDAKLRSDDPNVKTLARKWPICKDLKLLPIPSSETM